MKRLPILIILLLASAVNAFSQLAHKSKNPLQAQFDSLKIVNRGYYLAGKIDSMPPSNKRLLQLAEKINVDSTFVQAYNLIGNYFSAKADYSRGLEYIFKAIETANRGYRKFSPVLYGNIANDYNRLGNYEAARQSLHNAQKYLIYGSPSVRVYVPQVFASTYVNLKKPDSALKYVQIAFQGNMEIARMKIKDPVERGNVDLMWTVIYRNFAQVYDMLNEPELVNYYYRKAMHFSDSLNIQTTGATTAIFYGRYLLKQKRYNEAKKLWYQEL